MLFNSIPFLIFFPVVTLLYFLLPYRFRWMLLLAASCFFYMFFKPVYILILFFTIIIDYYAGILIENASGSRRKLYLSWSLVANIGVLAIFKYYNFINENATDLLHLFGVNNPVPFLKILLPIGLSFHTFQAMSYTIEVYRGNQKAERHFGIYALYVMFYPQLVAGPIERPQHILHQFYEKHDFSYERFMSGLNLMAWGFFKKMVIADRLSLYVDAVFNNMGAYKGFPLLWSMIFFSIQIYCDFSGYSDIARGTARVMGFELMINFNRPFFAHKLSDYWRRWHISLYSWFNDYLFNSLAVNLRNWGKWAIVVSILITFSVSGLWHGAAWTYVLWGLMHGIGLSIESLTKKPFKNFKKSIGEFYYNNLTRIITLAFVGCTFVVFRANSAHDVFYYFTHVFRFDHNIVGVPIFTSTYFLYNFFFMFLVLALDGLIVRNWFNIIKPGQEVNYQFLSITVLTVLIYIFGIFEAQSFIYFQF